MQELIEHLHAGKELTPELIENAVASLVDETVEADLKSSFLRLLREKGETGNEIAGFARALLARAVDPGIDPGRVPGPTIDVCGTGGDRMNLFNVSTTVMFVLAAGGACVVKHGNRGITSRSGGADVLEALGIRIDLSSERLRECVERTALGFIFAPAYHPAFKAIVPVRRALAEEGIPTIFNLLGPLLNPARPEYQLMGVFTEAAMPKIAHALALLGRKRAWVVHGTDAQGRGIDEVSTLGDTRVLHVENEAIEELRIALSDFTLHPAVLADLTGGSREENAVITLGILSGEISGPKRDLVVINSAAAFVTAGLAPDLAEGVALADEQIDSGRAMAKLRELRETGA
jgi:anthranilate phosphoribosyltransferase